MLFLKEQGVRCKTIVGEIAQGMIIVYENVTFVLDMEEKF